MCFLKNVEFYNDIFFKEEKGKGSMHFGVQLKPGTQNSIITGSFGFFPPGRFLLPISFKI